MLSTSNRTAERSDTETDGWDSNHRSFFARLGLLQPLFGGFFAYGDDASRRWRNPMMMADDVGGNRRWCGRSVNVKVGGKCLYE